MYISRAWNFRDFRELRKIHVSNLQEHSGEMDKQTRNEV